MKTGLSRASQLLLRNPRVLAGTRVLVIDAPAGDIGPVLAARLPDARVTLFQTDYADFRRARAAVDPGPRLHLQFAAWYDRPPVAHDLAIVYLPRGREPLDMTLAMVADVVDTGAPVLLVGPGRGGIRSALPALESRFGPATRLDAARHCVLYSARAAAPPVPCPRLDDWDLAYSVEVAGRRLELRSLPGVFSHGRLDEGTRLLLEAPPPTGRKSLLAERHGILDFGCGCGIIGAWYHALWPGARVDLTDSSALALEASRRTARLNGIPEDSVFPSDVFSDVRRRYGLVVSNPPFHAGIDTDYRVVEEFIAGAAGRLATKGTLRLVANRFLKYRPLLDRHFRTCRVVSETSRFRVFEALR